jgi:hypothetical protein
VQSQPLDLRDRLVADAERHFIPGMHALMRLPLEQARRDHARGIRTGTLITGYEDIKSRNAVRARARGGKLLRRLEDPTLPVAIAGQDVGD